MARSAHLLLATVLVAALAGCGDSASTGAGPATPAAPTAVANETVTATVGGRKIVGSCSGVRSGKPTVFLEVGMGAPRDSLVHVAGRLYEITQVCSYDRAGKGLSDPSARRPRPVAEVISDAYAFLAQARSQGAEPPYFLIGQSFGAELVILYAEAHPDQVAGFVAINPNPPYRTWLDRVRKVETAAEVKEFELPWPAGDNEEHVDTTTDESMLTDPLPDDLPYAVMYDAACGELPPDLQKPARCAGMLNALELTAKDLAAHGKGGVFVPVKGAGHDIQMTRADAVWSTTEAVWAKALAR